MPIQEYKSKANDKYNAKCDFIAIKPMKEKGAEIREAAKRSGMSLQGYILQAIAEKMERDGVISNNGS